MKQVPEVKVMANILLARNLATSLGGSSRALSPESDRIRFHQIRTLAKAILIGGQSYRNEPYSKLSLPLYISSRTLTEATSGRQFIFNQEPAWLIKRALLDKGSPVLIEGGVNFISSLITHSLIDLLYITRVNQDGDGHFFDESQLLKNYERRSIEIIDGASFESWRVKLKSSD
jgi:riboflavin biosynthesis pyrimidine reductase